MEIKTKYSIGQKVWVVYEEITRKEDPCERCKGTGIEEMYVKNGKEYVPSGTYVHCCACNGNRVVKHEYLELVASQATVDFIVVHSTGVYYELLDEGEERTPSDDLRFKQLYPKSENEVYATEQEAMEWIKKLKAGTWSLERGENEPA